MKFPFPTFSPEGGAAGGGAASSAPAGGGSPPSPSAGGAGINTPTGFGAGSQEGSAAEANAWKAPDYLPEHLRDADVSKTFEKVSADWRRLRDDVANRPAAPKTADEYKFDPGDKLKPYLAGDLGTDPAFAAVREAALKAGIPAGQFSSLVGGYLETLVDKGLIPKAHNIEAEREALIGERARTMTAEQKDEAIRPMLMPTVDFLKGLRLTGAIDEAGFAALGGVLDTAAGARALAQIVQLVNKAAPPGLNPGGAQAGGAQISHSDLKARLRDPRNTPGSMQFDRAFHAETDRLYQQAFR
jgi:hypothetical protein